MPPRNDWNEYKQLILRKMDDDQVKWDRMFELVGGLRTDVNGLKTQSKIAGGVAGTVGAGVVAFFVSLFHK